jgi:hypothetical protein
MFVSANFASSHVCTKLSKVGAFKTVVIVAQTRALRENLSKFEQETTKK